MNNLKDIDLQVEDIYKNNTFNDEWKLNYHFETPFGLINDPNGLIQYNGEYHLFFQWNPTGCEHKNKHWGLVKTKDFINFTYPKAVLAPVDSYDKNGCYSGSALEVDGKLQVLYTGNVKDEEGNRESYQCVGIWDDETGMEKLGPVVDTIPEGYTAHFRDPKAFKKDGKYYFVIGAQTNDLKGRALLYSSEDFKNWNFDGEIKTNYDDFGFMWECPSVLNIDGKDVLIFSPQGLEKEEFKNQNIYQSGYIIGEFNYETLEFKHSEFKELDMGFDFYAPQAFVDEKGRNLMIGWMGMPEEEHLHPTDKYNRMHCLTMVRELSIKDNILYQKPIKEYEELRKELLVDIENAEGCQWASSNIDKNSYELLLDVDKLDCSELQLIFAAGEEEYTTFKYDFINDVAILDRSNMKLGDRGVRKAKVRNNGNLKINMFIDESAVEIYLNDGEEVMSSRIYPSEGGTSLKMLCKGGNVKINNMKIWRLEGVAYNE